MPVVVIVDDDEDVARAIRSAFRLEGFEARTATAEECLSKIKEIGGDKVEAVTINGSLASDRGTMLIINIKKINLNIKIFVIAERHLEDTKVRVLDYGANEFVLKPISMTTIVDKVKMLLIEELPTARHSGAKA